MKRAAIPLADPLIAARLRAAGHRRRASVARSSQIEIPCAVGFRRPMILIPARLASSLDVEDLARIVLHESAHLQRYDDWLNALEQVVCALQFFQPALYVARRSIDFEREVACDDRVLEDAGEPLRYAECLARIVQRSVRGRQIAVVPGFVLRRAQVVARVRRIVDRSRDASPQLRIGAALLGGVVMVATLGIARVQVPLVAAASAEPVAPAPPAPVFVLTAPPVDPPRVTAPRRAAAAAPRAHRIRIRAAKPAPHAALAAATAPRAASPAPSASPQPAPAPVVRLQRVRPLLLPEVRRIQIDEIPVAPRVAPEVLLNAERLRAVSAEAAAIAPAVRLRALSAGALAAPLARMRVLADDAAPIPATVRVAAPYVVIARFGRGSDILDAIDEAKYPHPSVDELIALRNQGVTGDYIRPHGSAWAIAAVTARPDDARAAGRHPRLCRDARAAARRSADARRGALAARARRERALARRARRRRLPEAECSGRRIARRPGHLASLRSGIAGRRSAQPHSGAARRAVRTGRRRNVRAAARAARLPQSERRRDRASESEWDRTVKRFAVAALAALFLAGTVLPHTAAAAGSTTVGRWSIAARGDDPARVQLRLEYSDRSETGFSNSSWSSAVPLADAGIPADRLRGPIGAVTFQIQREPGTFACTGSAGEGSAAGQFTYAPSARFDDALAARGFGRPSYRQSLELAISGATLAFADQMRTSSPHATVADLLRVIQHGVSPRYVADMAAAGYKNLSAEDLIALRDHGVSVAFVDRLKAHGYNNLSARDLIRLRDAGL